MVGSSSEFPCVFSQCTDKNPSVISSLELPWAVQDGNSFWDKDILQLHPAFVAGQAGLSCPSSPRLSYALEKLLWLPPLLPHLTRILTLLP